MKPFNRRDFVKTTAAVAAASLIGPAHLFAAKDSRTIGIQLYTLREMMEEDFEGTLETIADIGYQTVESAGYKDGRFFGNYPAEFKKILEGLGLRHISAHIRVTQSTAPRIIEDILASGARYLVIPSMPEEYRKSTDGYKRMAEELNRIGQLCQKAGLGLGYHNHAFEFEDMKGITPYNILLDNTEPDLVCMELDIYWIIRAGYNPREYFERNPGRFKLWHVKDMDETEAMGFAPVGKGIINFQAIYKQKKAAGLEFSFVEQDTHENNTPVKNIRESFRYLDDLPAYG